MRCAKRTSTWVSGICNKATPLPRCGSSVLWWSLLRSSLMPTISSPWPMRKTTRPKPCSPLCSRRCASIPGTLRSHSALAALYLERQQYDLAWQHAQQAAHLGAPVQPLLEALRQAAGAST